jgi:cyclopropane fatty-acyl-phospholipid synthase-like methyltransferase
MVGENKKIVKEGYDTIAEKYLAIRREIHPRDMELLEELIQRLPKEAKVLDAGCGAGVPVTRTLSHFCEVVGVDFSEEQVRLAREQVPQAQFICQDMTELDFPEESFDAICSYYAIIHIPREEHRSLFKRFHCMLKPGGLVLLSMGFSDSAIDIEEDFFGARMYWSHFDVETNLKMLADCGFCIIWSDLVVEQLAFGGGRHPFVLAQKA